MRVAIAGLGKMGTLRSRLVQAHPDMTMVAAEDSNISALWGQKPDAMFVCLPTGLAAQATCDALSRGLHVFCEKPPAAHPNELKSVRKHQSEMPERVLAYGFNHRHHSSVTAALAEVQSGDWGVLQKIDGKYTKPGGLQGWRQNNKLAGAGILLDQGIHMLDLFRIFGGEFECLESRVECRSGGTVEDYVAARLLSDTGVEATIVSSAVAEEHCFELKLTMSAGVITLKGILSQTMQYAPEQLVFQGAKSGTTEYLEDCSFEREVDGFAQAVKNRSNNSILSLEHAYRTLLLVYKVYGADKSYASSQRFAERYGEP